MQLGRILKGLLEEWRQRHTVVYRARQTAFYLMVPLAVPCYKKGLKLRVLNQNRSTVLAETADIADTSEKRRRGLLKHSSLEPGDGLWIAPCEAVHSFGMKFAIDVLYLDKKKKVKKIRANMVPRRMSACLTAHSVLELPSGTAEATGTQRGDQLEFIKYEPSQSL